MDKAASAASVLLAATIPLMGSSSDPVFAQGASARCRDGLRGSGAYAYTVRGDRCEGMYEASVSGSPNLVVSSLTWQKPQHQRAERLELAWHPVDPSRAAVSVESMADRVYYRMDTYVVGGRYNWPQDVITGLGLSTTDLGYLGAQTTEIGARPTVVLVPISIGRQTWDPRECWLALVPSRELDELNFAVVEIDPRSGAPVTLPVTVGPARGFYPAGRAIYQKLALRDSSRVYAIQISARLPSGGTIASRVLIFNGAPSN